jgi:hypothetical protein
LNILKSRTLQRFLLVVSSGSFAWFCLEVPALLWMVDYRTLMGPFHMRWAPNVSDPELGIIHRRHAHRTSQLLDLSAFAIENGRSLPDRTQGAEFLDAELDTCSKGGINNCLWLNLDILPNQLTAKGTA